MFAAYVALSKPILVVVNTILFIYWLIRLRYWLWIPLTGLIVNYEYITSMYQIYNPTKYANENRLKVVTYNVHSFGNEITGFSAKEFAEMMNKEETDVLCFQEYRGNGDFTEQDLQNTYAKISTPQPPSSQYVIPILSNSSIIFIKSSFVVISFLVI